MKIHHTTNGIAAGTTMDRALLHALCELIERDAARAAGMTASTGSSSGFSGFSGGGGFGGGGGGSW